MAAPEVEAKVRVTPAKRRATFDVPLVKGTATANVNAKEVSIGTTMLSTSGRSGYYAYIGKTLADVDALAALLDAVRAELIEQGVTE